MGRPQAAGGHRPDRHAGPAVGATDASRDAGERMRKGRATAATSNLLYTLARAGRATLVPTKVVKLP